MKSGGKEEPTDRERILSRALKLVGPALLVRTLLNSAKVPYQEVHLKLTSSFSEVKDLGTFSLMDNDYSYHHQFIYGLILINQSLKNKNSK